MGADDRGVEETGGEVNIKLHPIFRSVTRQPYTTQAEFLEKFKYFTEQMNRVVGPKNQDYAGSNDAFRNLRRRGLLGVLVRMDDKMSRLDGYIERNSLQVQGESAIDTCVDLANYAIILACMIVEERTIKS